MSSAALTPRVRILVVCDEVEFSATEAQVFNLIGVRQYVRAEAFPWDYSCSLFLLLSSSRRGTYKGKILVCNERTEKVIRYEPFQSTFEDDNLILPLVVGLDGCRFPAPGTYLLQVYFTPPVGADVLKAELPFSIQTDED